jgi:putative ABC transport system permease protein
VGGLVGLGLGYLADGYTASSIIAAGGGGGGKSVVLKLIVDPVILGIGLAFALVMGAVGGFFPSLSAMRLRPLESLR